MFREGIVIDVFYRRLVRCGSVGKCDLVKDIRRIEIVRSTKEKISVNTQGDKNQAKGEEREVREKFTKIKEDTKCRPCIGTKLQIEFLSAEKEY